MSVWVKICANTSLADVLLAADAGADAVGFVLAPSPRRVTAEQVAAITPYLPPSIEKIGVFVSDDFATIASAVEIAGLTGIQLHSGISSDVAARLRDRFGGGLRILRVIHFGADAQAQMQIASADKDIDGILVDSRTTEAVGGTGVSFDWQSARATIFSSDRPLKLVAAGGLTPENVLSAVATLNPWGVDVASGVEYLPGHKSAQKVRDFVTNARTANPEV